MESHQRDHENYVACSRNRRRRAKALLDFERHDDDELGFRKNDIITVCQTVDRHHGGQADLACLGRCATSPAGERREEIRAQLGAQEKQLVLLGTAWG